MDKLTLEIQEGTGHHNDEETCRMHFYESSVKHDPTGERLLTITGRGGGMRATEAQVRELYEWLGRWLNG